MSFVFRGSRVDMERGLPGFIPERRVMRVHPGVRPVNSNSMAFLVTVILLFLILNSHQMSPNFLLWLVLGIFLMATVLRIYATCQQLQAQAHAVAASGLLGHTEFRFHVPPSIAMSTRGRLQSLRLQLALLDREFDDLDYDTLRALDGESPELPSMSEDEINALPVHQYKNQSHQRSSSSRQSDGSSQQHASTSSELLTESQLNDYWAVQMITVFKSQSIWDIVENEYQIPAADQTLSTAAQKALPENEVKDARAMLLIQQGVSKAIFSRIMPTTTTKEAWGLLKTKGLLRKSMTNPKLIQF